VLAGTLAYSSVGKLGQIQPSASLQGMVTSYDANGNVSSGMGPGNVSGEGYGPPPAAIGEGSLLGSALRRAVAPNVRFGLPAQPVDATPALNLPPCRAASQ